MKEFISKKRGNSRISAKMDIGRDVLTQTLLGSTEAEKVFTPWWITVHHYLVYTIVILVSEKNENY